MKKTLLILAFFAMIFAQEDGIYIPDEMTEIADDDSLFSIEEIAGNTEITETAVEPNLGEREIVPEILLSINEKTQIIAFDFQESSNGKTIEIINLTGDLVFKISAKTNESSISFSFKDFEKGIYIVRILIPETRRSVFSKAIVIG